MRDAHLPERRRGAAFGAAVTSPFPCPLCDAPASEADLLRATCGRCGRALEVQGFRLQRVLGRGGMSTIYEATSATGQRAAVKVHSLLHTKYAGGDGPWLAWEAFERGARVLMGLSHNQVPRVYAYAREAPARLFLVREVFDGGTLAERVAQGRRLGPDEVRAFAESLLLLLLYLHRRRPPVLHRDIKPANIMFRTATDWEPVLADFDTVAAPPAQRTGLTVVGTVGYAAPEQLAGEATPASDLYGLGATVLFLLTHVDPDRLPWRDGRVDLAAAVPGGLPPDLSRLLAGLVAPDPRDRFPSAQAALDALHPVAAPSPPAPQRPWLEPQRPWTGPLLALIVPLALLLGAAPVTYLLRQHPPAAWQRRDCERGVERACTALAQAARSELRPDDRARYLRRACELGGARSCYELAHDKLPGVSPTQETELYGRACELGEARGCAPGCLGHRRPSEGAPDLARARALCQRGCQLTDGLSCAELARLHLSGQGAARDRPGAIELIERACEIQLRLEGGACDELPELRRLGP